MEPLSGVDLKLRRAEHHLSALKTEIDAFAESKPYRVVPDIQNEGRNHILWLERTGELDETWSVMIGDCVHNLRCVLDHLTWLLSNPPVGTGGGRTTAFPICDTPDRFTEAKKRGRMKGVPGDCEALIEALQPYHRQHLLIRHPLLTIRDLSDVDKHQALHLVSSVLDAAQYGPPGILHHCERMIGPDTTPLGTIPFEHRTRIGTFFFFEPKPEMYVEVDFVCDVAFDPAGPGRGESVVTVLERAIDHIKGSVYPLLTRQILKAHRRRPEN